MSEYKENTVGWWLDRLKEPLRSRALEYPVLGNGAMSMASAVEHLIVWLRMTTEEFDKKLDAMAFWTGVKDYYHGGKKRQTHNPSYKDGWDMAKECAPDAGHPLFKDMEELGTSTGLPVNEKPVHARFPPKSGGMIDPEAHGKRRIAKLEARVKNLEHNVEVLVGALMEREKKESLGEGTARMPWYWKIGKGQENPPSAGKGND